MPDTDAEWAEGWVAPEGGDLAFEPAGETSRQRPEEIRQSVQDSWNEFRRQAISKNFDEESLLDQVEKRYSTSQAAAFFGRSPQWIYWGLRKDIFTYKDGTPIVPERVGKNRRRVFTLPLIREIALSHYRRCCLDDEELETIMARILLAEFGPAAFADTS